MKGESEVPIWIAGGILVAIIGVFIVFGAKAMIDGRSKDRKIDALQAQLQAAGLTPGDTPDALPKVFTKAKAYPASLSYVTADGATQLKSDVDALPVGTRNQVLKYVKDGGGRLVKTTCHQVNSKDGSWNAGYCTYETVQDWGKTAGPVG